MKNHIHLYNTNKPSGHEKFMKNTRERSGIRSFLLNYLTNIPINNVLLKTVFSHTSMERMIDYTWKEQDEQLMRQLSKWTKILTKGVLFQCIIYDNINRIRKHDNKWPDLPTGYRGDRENLAAR